MKLVSPLHRGSAWMWRCSAIPAPAARPRFRPKFMPCGWYVVRSAARSTRCIACIISCAVSGGSARQRVDMLIRHDQHMAGRVGIGVQADEARRTPLDRYALPARPRPLACPVRWRSRPRRSCCRRRSACPAIQATFQPAARPSSGRICSGDVAVSPWCPKVIHTRSIAWKLIPAKRRVKIRIAMLQRCVRLF